MPKVSIVAPVYGVEKYIDQFLESIKSQTFQDLEVILVDDGSPDNCPAILDTFVAQDDRYHVIHQKNGGVSVARNTGLAAATGEYVYIVDSDDWLTPNAVEGLYEAAIQNDADIVYGDYYSELPNGLSVLKQPFSAPFVTDDPKTIRSMQCVVFTNSISMNVTRPEFHYVDHMGGAPWRVLFRTSIIKDNALAYDPYVRGLGDDILFTLHYYDYVKKIAYVQHPIYHYRYVAISYSHGYKANYLETIARPLKKMKEFCEARLHNEELWDYYHLRVLIYLKEGMGRYFKNTKNPRTEKERFAEFKSVMHTEPYRTAAKKLPIRRVKNQKTQVGYMLLRMGMYRLYWLLKK